MLLFCDSSRNHFPFPATLQSAMGSPDAYNVTLTGNVIKQHLGLELTQEEHQLEKEYFRSINGRRRNR